MKDVKFDKRASKYDEGFEGRLSRRFYNSITNAVEVQDGFTVLDVGCGTGTVLRRISQKAAVDGYGIDISDEMLNEARQKCPNMNFQIGDSAALPFDDNSFDVVMTCMAYHHFPSQKDFRREALRVLKPQGRLYVCDPRFPLPVRALMNGIFKISHTNACFYKSSKIAKDFTDAGFTVIDVKKDIYVQTLVFEKK